jgi:hypothetical protein
MHVVWSVLKHAVLRVGYICVQMPNHIHSSVNAESALVIVKISSIKIALQIPAKGPNTLFLRANTPLDNLAQTKYELALSFPRPRPKIAYTVQSLQYTDCLDYRSGYSKGIL